VHLYSVFRNLEPYFFNPGTGTLLKEEDQPNKVNIKDETSWQETPWLALKGFLMGSADIIPGVSGGTMALITGIYDRLINAVRSVNGKVIASLLKFRFRDLLQEFHWKFILTLVAGIITAVIFFTRIVPLQVYMYTNPEFIYGLFFGLIVGSAVVLLNEINKEERNLKSFTALVLGTLFGFWIVTMVPANTPESFSFVFLSGMFAFSAMILPGISGSYILLILGKYDYVLEQLGILGNDGTVDAAFALLPLFLGGAVGLAIFSRILSWLLRKYHTITLMVLIGFLIGSLYAIWPYQEREYSEEVVRIEEYHIDDPIVQELRESSPDVNLPSYTRLGEIVNPDAPSPELYRIEVEYVNRNLIYSEPYIPYVSEKEQDPDFSFWNGIFGLLTGLVLVGALDFLRRKK
jgi:putative membrane protein